jgi:catalase
MCVSVSRQERFVKMWIEALQDPRVIPEVRSIWLSYWSQCDKTLGQKIAAHVGGKANM